MEIITNNVPRDIIYGYELFGDEKAEFEYLDDIEAALFFRYKGELYDLGEFMIWDNPASPTRGNWDGFRSDSFFSGLVVRYHCDDQIIVGLALS